MALAKMRVETDDLTEHQLADSHNCRNIFDNIYGTNIRNGEGDKTLD
jgi:hypothetical protein